jgi:hypothetical protein
LVPITQLQSYNPIPMRRPFAVFVLVEFFFVGLFFYSDFKEFLWMHPWWHSFLVLLPGIAAPVLATLDLHHSAEVNHLRAALVEAQFEANDQRQEMAKALAKIGELQAELDKKRNDSPGPP